MQETVQLWLLEKAWEMAWREEPRTIKPRGGVVIDRFAKYYQALADAVFTRPEDENSQR